MRVYSSGLIENTPVSGVRPSVTLAVIITNDDTVTASVEIKGYYSTGTTKTMYVDEIFILPPEGVFSKSYYAQFDSFEYQFITNSVAIQISAWGKDAQGNLTTAQRMLPEEINSIG